MGYIYRHVRHDNNEPFYIGIGLTDDPEYKRAYSKKGRNNIWKGIVSRTTYSVHIMMDDLSAEDVKEKEKEFIKLYGRIACGTGVLCNLTDGGDGSVGVIVSEETRRKQSEAHKGKKYEISEEFRQYLIKRNKNGLTEETKEKLRVAMTGRKHTQETKDKMSFDRSGEKHPLFGKSPSKETREKWSKTRKGRPSPHKKKVIDTITGIEYDSVKEAIENLELNISTSHLNAMIRGVYPNWTNLKFL